MKKIIYLIFPLVLFACKNQNEEAHNQVSKSSLSIPCQNEKTLSCLDKNYIELYQKDYLLFFSIINKYSKSIESGCNYEVGKEFLSFVGRNKFDGEVGESISEIIETAFFTNSTCLLDIVLNLESQTSQENILYYLKQPTFHKPEEASKLYKNLSKNKKYKKLFE